MRPLESRVFKYKQAAMKFFCPLCRTERAILTHPRMTKYNVLQIILSTLLIGVCVYPYTRAWAIVIALTCGLAIWGGMEIYKRLNFRKEVPCPHCGFDASWYKRDVKMARKLVERHWQLPAEQPGEESNLTQ